MFLLQPPIVPPMPDAPAQGPPLWVAVAMALALGCLFGLVAWLIEGAAEPLINGEPVPLSKPDPELAPGHGSVYSVNEPPPR